MREEVLDPLVTWALDSCRRLRRWTMEDVVKPTARQVVVAMSALTVLVHEEVVVPLWLHGQVALKRSRHYALVQWVQPAWDWLYEQLPEKTVFVDDSDTELAGLLPESKTGGSSRRSPHRSAALSRRHSDEDSDEAELRHGLRFHDQEDIPDSDSSDDEFSLRYALRRRRKPACPAPNNNNQSSAAPNLTLRSSEPEDEFELLDTPPDIDAAS